MMAQRRKVMRGSHAKTTWGDRIRHRRCLYRRELLLRRDSWRTTSSSQKMHAMPSASRKSPRRLHPEARWIY